MKTRFFAIFGALALISVSCSVKENLENPANGGHKITLIGESYTAPADTKVSIGEKDGDVYPLLWVTGDVIRISTAGASEATDDTFLNEAAEYFGDSGVTSGVFQTTNDLIPQSNMDLVITYPGTATYSAGTVTSSVSSLQSQRRANSSLHVGNYALAYALTSIEAEQTDGVEFTLQHQTAFVKLELSSTLYSEYSLTTARLFAPGETLSGEMSYDIDAGTTSISDAGESVGASITNTSTFSETQEVYFTAIPCDLTDNNEVYIIVSMTHPSDGSTVTVPVKVDGGELRASCLSVIKLSGIGSSVESVEWYEPVETRDLVDGWAYGAQNTYLIEQKASGEGPTKLTFEVKARGDFSKVKEPKYYALLSASSISTRRLLYLEGEVTTQTTSAPTHTVNDDYTIDVYCYDQGSNGVWGTVAIFDADYNILWSYMIMRYFTDDPVLEVEYPGTNVVLMDRPLGGGYSSSYAEEQGQFNSVPIAYFQWGRKDPYMWSISDQVYNVRYTPENFGIEDAIAEPYYRNSSNSSNNYMQDDWQDKEHRADLWGGVNTTSDWYDAGSVGYKTIYDPCPAGYRVPDAWVFNIVKNNAEIWEANNGNALQNESRLNPDSPFYSASQSTLAYPLGDGKYDYWQYGGALWSSSESWGNRPSNTTNYTCMYWSNNVLPSNELRGVWLEYCYYSSSYQTRTDGARGTTLSVRCQKDEENR